MSPNEFQLRAALREGEGEGVNPGDVIARARARRQGRRVRYLSTAAITVVVAGIGVAGGLALSGSSDHPADSAQSRKAAEGGGAATQNPYGSANGAAVPDRDAPAVAATVQCPATLPQLTPPVSGGRGALFATPVAAIKVCAYPQTGGAQVAGRNGTPVTTVLTGARATAVAASLDGASKTRQTQPCPLYRSADGRTLLLYGVSPGLPVLPPVAATVAQNPCNLPVTNGRAVRYDWTPPAILDAFLATVRAAR